MSEPVSGQAEPLAQDSDGMCQDALYASLRGCSHDGRPLALYVHIPFCANACYFCSRPRIIGKDRSQARSYLQLLYREIELMGAGLAHLPLVERLHLGGGTPTFLGHADLAELMSRLRAGFNLHSDDNADYSIDVDPREADWTTLGVLRELGFNRVSLGVQDLDAEVQRAVNRLQTAEQTQAVMDAARALAYRSVGMELVYGLPRQTEASFARTLADVIGMKPDRLTLHRYVHRPVLHASQRRLSAAELPGRDGCRHIFRNSRHQLEQAGYRFIGRGQFALPDDDLGLARETGLLIRDRQGYVAGVACDEIGLGVSASSRVGRLCWRNTSDLLEYRQHLAAGRLPLYQAAERGA